MTVALVGLALLGTAAGVAAGYYGDPLPLASTFGAAGIFGHGGSPTAFLLGGVVGLVIPFVLRRRDRTP